DAGSDLFDLREAEAIAQRLDEIEARDVHLPGDDPLDAPDPGVVVEAGPLSGTPRHDAGGVAEVVVAKEEAARVVVSERAHERLRDVEVFRPDQVAKRGLDVARHRVDLA